ncbi:MAG: hypothetical protein HKN25_10535 [Pyrinomonadaceae bacterium]|nr:hypothetical protein [Pyrinomonadaceae bacterium]
MENFLRENGEKKRSKKGLITAVLVALVVVAGVILAISFIPSNSEMKADALEGAFFEDSKEFQEYTKEIIITTDPDRLLQSMTGMGKIIMNIGGRIRNKGDKSLSALQVKVGVVDSKSEVIKERKFIIIPSFNKSTLGPSESIDVSVSIGGFTREDDRANVRWKVTAIKFAD